MAKEYVNVRIEKSVYEKIVAAYVPNYLYFWGKDKSKIEIHWSYIDKATPKIEAILNFWVNNSDLHFKTMFFKQCLIYENIETLLNCQHFTQSNCTRCNIKHCQYCQSWQHSVLNKCINDEKIDKHKFKDNLYTKLSYKMYAK